MTHPNPNPAYEIPAEFAELLQAVVEALDVPDPADYSPEGLVAQRDVLQMRAFLVRMAARRILNPVEEWSPSVAWEAESLRQMSAEHPITYTSHIEGGAS